MFVRSKRWSLMYFLVCQELEAYFMRRWVMYFVFFFFSIYLRHSEIRTVSLVQLFSIVWHLANRETLWKWLDLYALAGRSYLFGTSNHFTQSLTSVGQYFIFFFLSYIHIWTPLLCLKWHHGVITYLNLIFWSIRLIHYILVKLMPLTIISND